MITRKKFENRNQQSGRVQIFLLITFAKRAQPLSITSA
jgi:hypothetical protein